MRGFPRVVHNRRGSAYLFVVVAVMTITLLAGAALAVTVAGRRVSARYIDFAGLYDLAVAGNEEALFRLRDALYTVLQAAENNENDNDGYGNGENGNDTDLPLSPAEIQILIFRDFTAARPWSVVLFGEDFNATTTVTQRFPGGDNPSDAIFRVRTRINNASAAAPDMVVQADIVLDAQSLAMVHSRRITN